MLPNDSVILVASLKALLCGSEDRDKNISFSADWLSDAGRSAETVRRLVRLFCSALT